MSAIVARDFDGFRWDEASLAENEFRAALVEAVLMHRYEAVHHIAFALAHRADIDAGLRRVKAERRYLLGGVCDLGGVDHGLTREAGDFGAGAADVTALDQRGFSAGGSHVPGDVLSGLSTAKNEDIALFYFTLFRFTR